MEELGLDSQVASQWFKPIQNASILQVAVEGSTTVLWPQQLLHAVRRAYITDAQIAAGAAKNSVTDLEVIASKLPDAGSIMAGDFGEILVYIYHASNTTGPKLVGPKKWRMKQDRRHAAPHSDVVLFSLPHWPHPSSSDVVYCSEVKTKSTVAPSEPIATAIAGAEKDRASRLAKTLVWLRERAMTENLGAIDIPRLERFINAAQHPPATWRYFAVAVICSSVAQAEMAQLPKSYPAGVLLIVIIVPNLKGTYTAVFEAVRSTSLGTFT